NKLLLVRAVEKYTPERPENMQLYALLEIPLKIEEYPYWISRYIIIDLHNNKSITVNGHWSFAIGVDVSPYNIIYQYIICIEFNIYNAGNTLKKKLEKED